MERPSAATSASIRGSRSRYELRTGIHRREVDSTGLSQRNSAHPARAVDPALAALDALDEGRAHLSTEVVLFSGHGSLASISPNAGRSDLVSRTSGGVDPRHVRRADGDAEVRDLQSQRVGEVLDARLGRVVRRQPRRRGERGQRRHDQHIAPPLDDRRQRGAHGVEDAEHVDVQHPLERLRIDLQHRAVAGDAGVGDDDVDAAEAFDGLRRRRPAWRPDRGRRRPRSAPARRRSSAASASSAASSRSVSTSLAPLRAADGRLRRRFPGRPR